MSEGAVPSEGGEIAVSFSELRTCKLSGCGGPRSGVCINSLPFDECPDVVEALPETPEIADPAPAKPAELPGFIRLPGGHALGAKTCDALLRQRGGVIVGLVAGPEAGKTTLIGTVYELVTRRRMKNFGFAGSETLRGFEERCHLARLSSNNAAADTPRTPAKDQLSFTHLAIATGGSKRDLVFSDRSGEHFDTALDRPNQIAGFVELARADVILMLVDLQALLKNPHSQTASARKWFMAMDQHGILTGSRFFLIGTKADQVVSVPRRKRAAQALSELGADLESRSKAGHAVDTRLVSCRPQKGETVIGEGLEELLADLLEPPAARQTTIEDAWPEEPTEVDLLMRSYRAALT